ncbi:MAG: lipopolysaccharide heptosyltransferase family protein [Deltaproteobacteria bacterium]|nr:lipopolysaccharide heptosyltransferase family protein [Deltaproteobacteria bacterium]MBW2008942.1 lipopolysaccharide heptosyltransferase family protein [Deltaproteobacteria bacterium]
MLSGVKRVAVFCSDGIGDALIYLTLAHNLHRNHYEATLFSPAARGLQSWFPHLAIEEPPIPEDFGKVLGRFDLVLAQAHSPADRLVERVPVPCHVFKKHLLDRHRSMVENLVTFCRRTLALPRVSPENGIRIPGGLEPRRIRRRVIIHPTSKDEAKNWALRKFIGVARRLDAAGYEVAFILAPEEQPEWRAIFGDRFEMPRLKTLDALARYTCESGWMIGSDSGVGHLANNLGVPTLSVFSRRGTARYWRPGWGPGAVIYPRLAVPGRWGRRHWSMFLSVNRVMRAFRALEETVS